MRLVKDLTLCFLMLIFVIIIVIICVSLYVNSMHFVRVFMCALVRTLVRALVCKFYIQLFDGVHLGEFLQPQHTLILFRLTLASLTNLASPWRGLEPARRAFELVRAPISQGSDQSGPSLTLSGLGPARTMYQPRHRID